MSSIVTTYLQMNAPDELLPAGLSDPDFIVREAVERDWRLNRSLYLLVGERWAWVDKQHRDDALAVEIAYFGLAPDFIGRGFGGALLTDALKRAWAWDARRVWVHTCSLDHPAALRNYQARGMQVYDRKTHRADVPGLQPSAARASQRRIGSVMSGERPT